MIGGRVNTIIAIEMFRSQNKNLNAALLVAVGGMAKEAKAHCKVLLTTVGDDHTLADLAKLDHPYARRAPQYNIHDPFEQVHERRGELVEGLIDTTPVASHDYVQASVFNKAQPLDTMIQVGTRSMVGRPYMDYVKRVFGEKIQAVGMKLFRAMWISLRGAA